MRTSSRVTGAEVAAGPQKTCHFHPTDSTNDSKQLGMWCRETVVKSWLDDYARKENGAIHKLPDTQHGLADDPNRNSFILPVANVREHQVAMAAVDRSCLN